jgi:diguanylate cyclase (GGDEF)-like protein
MPQTDTHSPPRILVIDDDPGVLLALRPALDGLGAQSFASRGSEAVRRIGEIQPDVLLLDADLPDVASFPIFETLRADPALADVPVLLVTRHGEQDIEPSALDLGAVDFITRPVRPAIVALRVQTLLRLRAANDRLRRHAAIDPLTGLPDRRAFDEVFDREWRRCQRSGLPISLLKLDVDGFQRFNHHHGHSKGDHCLVAVTGALHGCVRRPFDVLARSGGQEFLVLLPETDARGALLVGRRILSTLAAMTLSHATSDVATHVTVSIGASSHDATCNAWLRIDGEPFTVIDPGIDGDDLLTAADLALHIAKRRGRAQQCFRSIDAAVDARLAAAAA